MTGKVCVVTGATAGLGAATAEALARRGATVVLVGRNAERCAAAADKLRRETGNRFVEFLTADLSSQCAIRLLARTFMERYDGLHVLVNNAGGLFMRRRESADGVEMTFALNHLGYFLLTQQLLDLLKASAPARIINVSSFGHQYAPPSNFADEELRGRYRGIATYNRSKLANLLFTYELARRVAGTRVTVNAVDPGLVATDLGRNNGWLYRPLKAAFRLAFRAKFASPEEGARTIVYLASSTDVDGVTGRYFSKTVAIASSEPSYDDVSARRLWELSVRLTSEPSLIVAEGSR